MDDIINYTMENPDNTNPNVLRSMLENYRKSDGGDSMFYVNITPPVEEGGNPTADKTFEEMKFAFNSGKNVVASINGVLFWLSAVEFDNEENVTAFNFARTEIIPDPSTQKGTIYHTRMFIDSEVVAPID